MLEQRVLPSSPKDCYSQVEGGGVWEGDQLLRREISSLGKGDQLLRREISSLGGETYLLRPDRTASGRKPDLNAQRPQEFSELSGRYTRPRVFWLSGLSHEEKLKPTDGITLSRRTGIRSGSCKTCRVERSLVAISRNGWKQH